MVFQMEGFEQGSSADPAARIEMRREEVKIVVKGAEDTVVCEGVMAVPRARGARDACDD